MSSDAKILANRLNALKSTGPRSAQGKAAVSKNAVKHGLLAEHDVIDSENEADFDQYRRQLLDELKPVSPMESMLAERIVTLSWRLKRAGRFQNQAINVLNSEDASDPLKRLTQSVLFKTALRGFANSENIDLPQPAPPAVDDRWPLGRMAVKDFSDARVLDRLLMYERRIEHSLFKNLLELQRLHLIKKFDRNVSQLPANNHQ
jgi:hypothetical protein